MEKEFDVWEHFHEWEGWTCDICNELLESSDNILIQHLEEKHGLKFKE